METVIYDRLERCSYLAGRLARLPLRLPEAPVGPAAFDERLSGGERRVGRAFYRPQCPDCVACQPVRLAVQTFQASRSQRRVWRRNQDLRVTLHPPICTERHLELFNRHRAARGLEAQGGPLSARGYWGWFVDSCTRTFEIRYRTGKRLIGVAIVDVAAASLSAGYTYFDPLESGRSLGTFSILYQLDLARRTGLQFLYLGFFVEACPALFYKSTIAPHQRLIGGVWRDCQRLPPRSPAP